MKSILVFFIFYFLWLPSGTYSAGINQLESLPLADTTSAGEEQSTRIQRRNYTDHPVLQGDRATDWGESAAGHLAPLIFLVLAFIIAFIAGCLGWNKLVLHAGNGNNIAQQTFGPFKRTLLTLLFISAVFAAIAGLLLLNISNYMSHGHTHEDNWFVGLYENHHLIEILFSFLTFLVLLITGFLMIRKEPAVQMQVQGVASTPQQDPHRKFFNLFVVLMVLSGVYIVLIIFNLAHFTDDFFRGLLLGFLALFLIVTLLCLILIFLWRNAIVISDQRFQVSIFYASFLALTGVFILLFPNRYFKLCNGDCIMLGSQTGLVFDQPCADNIAFMTLHHTMNLDVDDYENRYETTPFPLFYEYSSPIAMHNPLFPAVQTTGGVTLSEPITFTLKDDKDLVKTCSLFVKTTQFAGGNLGPLTVIDEASDPWQAIWARNGTRFDKTEADGTIVLSDSIFHIQTIPALNAGITFVTYMFIVTYLPYENAQNLVVQTPDESIVVHFVLQDFHLRRPKSPAPVYVQGNIEDLMDVLFIPAIRHESNDVIDNQFLIRFRNSCRSIIKDAIFQEPSLKFWRKQFNFWIYPEAGEAFDARCSNCCHEVPDDFAEFVSKDFEFKALLHKETLWDFTDHCNTIFSAEMDLINDNNERSSFLHEFGHAAYGLSDEYQGGNNEEAMDHLPNNWRSWWRATRDAPLRHKTEDDAQKLF